MSLVGHIPTAGICGWKRKPSIIAKDGWAQQQ
jgi:hypothetical protein